MIQIDGLISGIDTSEIIEGLLDIQQTQIKRLESQQQQVQARRAAFQSLEAQVISLRSAAGALSRIQNNVFEARSVSVSHEDALLATVRSRATTGTYQLQIDSLARAHQVASQGFSSPDAAITEGTFTIARGSQPAVEITIDSSNNTLTGLADAINFSNAGISASVIQDGSADGSPYRLLLSSRETGTAHEITITNNLGESADGAIKPVFDLENPVQAAANAQVRLGDGPGALTVESATNEVRDLIPGVTLNLLAADPGRTITLRVAGDTKPAVDAVQGLVDAYNDVMDFIQDLIRFDPETEEAGILLGDRTVVDIQNEIRAQLQEVIPGLSTQANRLSTLGISFNDRGRLVLNRSRLEDALSGRVEGVTSDDLRRLFALDATSSSSNVEFILGSSRTRESASPYQVQITQAATRAFVTGSSPLEESTEIDATNNSLNLTIDGLNLDVTLNEGTYTRQELAAELQTVIRAHPDLGGRSVTVSLEADGALRIRSDQYGSSSQVTVFEGTTLAALKLGAGVTGAGTDVAGHFIVDGNIEEATGRGRVLTGKVDNEHTADLQFRVTATAAQVAEGFQAEITVTRGLAARLEQRLGRILHAETGRMQSADRRFTQQIDGIQSSIDRQRAIFERQQENLIKQFVALESAMGEIQNTSTMLANQLANLPSLRGPQR
jgi:flagellar hook-associated protein 2